jgi:hypothetical protein
MWYETQNLPGGLSAELAVIDGPPNATGHLARYPAAHFLLPLLAPNAAIVLDDADRDDERVMVERWLKDHPELAIAADLNEYEKGCVTLTRSGEPQSHKRNAQSGVPPEDTSVA